MASVEKIHLLLAAYCLTLLNFTEQIDLVVDTQCDKIDFSQFKLMGTTTNYDDIRGDGIVVNEGFQVVQVWALFRHGIRYPDSHSTLRMKGILTEMKQNISRNYARGEGYLCPEDFDALEKWQFDELTMFEYLFLTKPGIDQMQTIGRRMRQYFPELLDRAYDPERVLFASSSSQRALSSMRAFVDGVYENDGSFLSSYLSEHDLVAEYDCLARQNHGLVNSYEVHPEVQEFLITSDLYSKISKSLSYRTGLPSNTFTDSVINTLFEACSYETPRYSKLSPWCRVFSLHDLELLRSKEEIIHYYHTAYGSEYKDEFGCIQLKSLIANFNGTDSNNHKFKAYFTHDGNIEVLLCKMGCFKDPLITSNYANFDKHHVWNISAIAPFAGNVVVVLYDVGNGPDDYELQIYLNERPIGCCMSDGTQACKWSDFRTYHERFVLSCAEDFCEENDPLLFEDQTGVSAATTINLAYNTIVLCILNYIHGR